MFLVFASLRFSPSLFCLLASNDSRSCLVLIVRCWYLSSGVLDVWKHQELDVLLGEEDRFMSKFENTNPAREDEEPVLLKDQYILPDEKMEMVRPPVPEGYSSGEIAPDFLFVDASCPFDGLFTSFFGCCCCWCHANNLLIVVAMGCWGIVNKNSWI